MADEFFTQNPQALPARTRGSGGRIALAALAAFAVGAGGVGYAAWEGLIPFQRPGSVQLVSPAQSPAQQADTTADDAVLSAAADTLGGRIAALELRLNALDQRADAASGNTARAEALLIAFAARRALDRGVELGFLEDQLRLRFANAQPNAVATVINAGKQPVTVDQLVAGLDALGETLVDEPAAGSAWDRVRREFSGLFVIRHESSPSPAPQAMLDRARVLLAAGKTDDAIAEVGRLPGSSAAGDWFAAAKRYSESHRALDVLETTALLDTRALKDASGSTVEGPSPIAPSAVSASAAAGF